MSALARRGWTATSHAVTEIRLFAVSTTRTFVPLSGPWEFRFPASGDALDPDAWAEGEPVVAQVPGVWEALPGRGRYRGEVVARRRFRLPRAGAVRLVFKGVSHTARVFVDGRELGTHHNAYTPFAFALPELTAGDHDLLVHVSNRFGELSALHVPNDYHTYGGITRPAEVQLLRDPCFVERLLATPRRDARGWSLQVRVRLRNLGPAATTRRVRVCGPGRTAEQAVSVGPDATAEVGFLLELGPDVAAWSPEEPQLHFVRAELRDEGGEMVDDLVERIGLREVRCDGERLLLNGCPLRLRGFNRHEDHARHGCALPVEAMREDLRLLRLLHANAIRTSHYPNDERFLDLCDEMGVLVWEENHARGLYEGGGAATMHHPRFAEQCAAVNAEMVLEHFNHPCIVLWGILNECESFSAAGRAHYAAQLEQIRGLDPSRPTTFATLHNHPVGHPQREACLDLPDVCSWNIYPGWYRDDTAGQRLAMLLDRFGPEMAGRPLLLSEFGAGAIPGFRDPETRLKWSEERQADILADCLATFLAHPRVAGVFVWQFCDNRVSEEWTLVRPRCVNDKGVFDGERRPKLAADIVARAFAADVRKDCADQGGAPRHPHSQ